MNANVAVPYLSQLDNQLSPHGTCNTTCLAMGLSFYNIPVPGQYRQMEDNLTNFFLNNGYDRHRPEDIATVAHHFGLGDNYTPAATWDGIKTHLRSGHPVIVHGWFTPSGHIVVIRGFDEAQGVWFVNDPNGVHPYQDWRSGESVPYPGEMMRRVCGSDGDLWAHFLHR